MLAALSLPHSIKIAGRAPFTQWLFQIDRGVPGLGGERVAKRSSDNFSFPRSVGTTRTNGGIGTRERERELCFLPCTLSFSLPSPSRFSGRACHNLLTACNIPSFVTFVRTPAFPFFSSIIFFIPFPSSPSFSSAYYYSNAPCRGYRYLDMTA